MASRELLDAYRYMVRGTRRRKGNARTVSAEFAGYLMSEAGAARSLGEFRSELLGQLAPVDLQDHELIALTNYFGLLGWPFDLTGDHGLVGRLALPRRKSHPVKRASRATVQKWLRSAVERIDEQIESRPVESPVEVPSARNPLENVSATELSADLVRSAMYQALAFVARSPQHDEVREAIRRLCMPVLLGESGSEALDESPEQEVRHAAMAALDIGLFEAIEADAPTPSGPAQLSGSEFFRLGIRYGEPLLSGFTAALPDGKLISTEFAADDFVSAVKAVSDRNDPQGRITDVVLGSIQDQELSDTENVRATTVGWVMAQGLATANSWRVFEVVGAFIGAHELDENVVQMLSWAAQVAATDGDFWLASRYSELSVALAKELAAEAGENDRGFVLEQTRYQVNLIRSGAALREAQRYRRLGLGNQASSLITAGTDLIEEARAGWHALQELRPRPAAVGLPLLMRWAELTVEAGWLRHLNHPVKGSAGEVKLAQRLVASCVDTAAGHHIDDLETAAIRSDRLIALQADLADLQIAMSG